ncbi:Endonuclease III [Dissulfuribacter thermophilus]|uniref:Endonuclease III n=1 Tax=Dissulfuribacter thermophilus TaxID=1156395 RepID=A0A1B9F6B4_9BACT|nr:endonuclease III [Dissulfuribacter thermophilus]OCC15311.1 Endonuclease III [Dissulfuribacter thermophilus]
MRGDAPKASYVNEILSRLEKAYPNAKIALNFSSPYELLVAVVLSAQCTDKRVNEVTPQVFKKLPTPEAMANAPIEEIEELIRPTGFFRNKAKNLKRACQMIIEKFDGKVPKTMEEILTLPGVARKTANCVLYNAYGEVTGIPVDTHVKRLSKRLGLTKNDNPDKIERDLMAIIPKEKWGPFSYELIEHGRAICKARKPRCEKCVLNDICPSAFNF